MRFAVLHLSDLHRDLNDEVGNPALLESLVRDFDQYGRQEPPILRPALCVVTGDFVYGVQPSAINGADELSRQFAQAEEFLVGLADRLFDGRRDRVVIVPGNHDVSYIDVMASATRIDVPLEPQARASLVADLFRPTSNLRWSWAELCFYRIVDASRYQNRLRQFALMYESFYQERRAFPLEPDRQYDVFDFPEYGFCVLTLNSCYNNDPLRRVATFHPTGVAEACRALREPYRAGWLIVAAWHHNLFGGPAQNDYLDVEVVQVLMDAGVSLGVHGHQHMSDCVDERYRIGTRPRKMTLVSAGTLCAGPRNLSPGAPRSYNVIEIDTDSWNGRVHQRQMVNRLYNLPVWGPGHFNATNRSFLAFDVCEPLANRPGNLDAQLALERAEGFVGSQRWDEAVAVLSPVKSVPLARPILAKALSELGDPRRTIDILWPPETSGEAVIVAGAILDDGTQEDVDAFVRLQLVSNSADASVREMTRRLRERQRR